jgi:archaemetzincin
LKFIAPTGDEVCHAIGALDKLPEELRNALLPLRDFEPIPAPSPNDWLAVHPGRDQTFDDFVTSRPKKPSPARNTIYLQPLEDFETEDAPAIQHLARFASAFFAIARRSTCRIRGVETTDYNAHQSANTTITTPDRRCTRFAAADLAGKCLLHCRNYDARPLPRPSWNFVFGEASLSDRVGVFSFARYDPEFYGIPTAERDALMMRRSCKVLAHKTSHMFGIPEFSTAFSLTA